MKFTTTRFGALDIDESATITFSEGIIGFEKLKRYVILSKTTNAPLRWLQSVDEPGLAFIIISPFIFKPDYLPVVEPQDLKTLKLKDVRESEVLTIVVVPENPRDMVANLMAPIVINPKLCIGKQIVMTESNYPTRYRILDGLDKTAQSKQTVSC